jgi:hypothetical protein
MLVGFQRVTRRCIPEHSALCRENLRSALGDFLISWSTITLSRRTLLLGVRYQSIDGLLSSKAPLKAQRG